MYAKERVSAVERWGEKFTPACECGCGDPVKIGPTGPRRFIDRQHLYWSRLPSDWSNLASKGRAARSEMDGGLIPIERFRAFVERLHDGKKWSYREIAQKGGQTKGWLDYYLYDSRAKNIGRVTASLFIKRIAGEAVKPSRLQQREAKKHSEQRNRIINEIGMDAKQLRTQDTGWGHYTTNKARKNRLNSVKG